MKRLINLFKRKARPTRLTKRELDIIISYCEGGGLSTDGYRLLPKLSQMYRECPNSDPF